MRLVQSLAALRACLDAVAGETVGLVPTMGALHQGHLSLIHRARQDCHQVVVSLFVNPLQFGPQEDFQRYPRTLDADQILCQEAGVDILFAPSLTILLGDPDRPRTQVIPPQDLMQTLCAPFRPGHFAGVLTIVMTLFHVVRPHRAYFGQKDVQQVRLIQQMVADLHLPVEIIPCPTVRDADGLATSSRNAYLSASERASALGIPHALAQGQILFLQGNKDAAAILSATRSFLSTVPSLNVQYLQLVHPKTLHPIDCIDQEGLLAMAAYVGTTRLIDHVQLSHHRPIIAIDGPAGAGKSTVARRVAEALNLTYLDTGAMYRAITWLALNQGIPLTDEPLLAELAAAAEIELAPLVSVELPVRIRLNGKDVTEQIRSQAVTQSVSTVAAWPAVRQELVRQQQALGAGGGTVLEGRDIGTYVFPQAELKIFLTASVDERARRRQIDLAELGEPTDLALLQAQIAHRDSQDQNRSMAPLQQAPDAILINTDQMSIAAVVAAIIDLYQVRLQTGRTRDPGEYLPKSAQNP